MAPPLTCSAGTVAVDAVDVVDVDAFDPLLHDETARAAATTATPTANRLSEGRTLEVWKITTYYVNHGCHSGSGSVIDGGARSGLGAALRRAWVGYQRRLDAALAAAGFDDRGFPDGRVLRQCLGAPDTTISQIGRQLGISRQAAAKVVATLRDRGYVVVVASSTNGRDKPVRLTPRAVEYLAAQRDAARAIERELRTEVGNEGFVALERLLEALGGTDEVRMRDYLHKMRNLGPRRYPDD